MNSRTVDTKLMKALAHPLRQQLLMALSDRVASPSELAEELGEPLGNVSYHVRMLVDLGSIELVSTTPRRGALEHHYKAVVRPLLDDSSYATFPTSTKRALIGDILKEIWSDVGAAAEADGFDDEKVHVSRQPITLDAEGWTEVAKVLEDAVYQIEDIKAKSGKRLGKNGADAIQSVVAILHFRAGVTAPAAKGKAKPKRRTTKKTSTKR
ncbi:MAG TPA: winged helix-turn-helix domain-containing protein [Solirubrobacteraceae bacterium]|nr:winged helix-turn-helix domain-containing protein [Solirubrobacteraceae bacterium]